MLGWSQCSLCNRTLLEGDEVIGMPDALPFPVWIHADSAMHLACFRAWPLACYVVADFNDHNATETGDRVRMFEDGTFTDDEYISPRP